MSHVIAAVSTGNQISAIGILRLTGDCCAQVAGKVFTLSNGTPLWEAPNRKLMLGSLHEKEGRVIDQCMAVYTRGPHSYTGEDTVEIQCHGSPAVLAAGLEALFLAGAKPAKRGEFTKRAFMNGQCCYRSDRSRNRRCCCQCCRAGRRHLAEEAVTGIQRSDRSLQSFSRCSGLSR